jgi:hypothetical protein
MEETGLNFNILLKKEEDLFVAHCLELDIVATGDTVQQAKNDVLDLIVAQVDYAFSNDNLDHLYHPAPPEVWREFFACKGIPEALKRKVGAARKKTSVPPQIVASTCLCVA